MAVSHGGNRKGRVNTGEPGQAITVCGLQGALAQMIFWGEAGRGLVMAGGISSLTQERGKCQGRWQNRMISTPIVLQGYLEKSFILHFLPGFARGELPSARKDMPDNPPPINLKKVPRLCYPGNFRDLLEESY